MGPTPPSDEFDVMELPNSAPDSLNTSGFFVARLFDRETIERVLTFYRSLDLTEVTGNYCSIHETDQGLKRRITDYLSPLLSDRLAGLDIVETCVMGGVFVVKAPTTMHVVPHQDPTLVAEPRFRSLNIWLPLQDVGRENGCLWVLPNSQYDGPSARPANGYAYPSFYGQIPEAEVWEAMVPIEMAAGEALIYDHRLLHGSKGNHGTQDRIAVVSALRAPDAELRFYLAGQEAGRHVISEYVMAEGDYFTFVDFVPQSGNLTRQVVAEPSFMPPDEFRHRYLNPAAWAGRDPEERVTP